MRRGWMTVMTERRKLGFHREISASAPRSVAYMNWLSLEGLKEPAEGWLRAIAMPPMMECSSSSRCRDARGAALAMGLVFAEWASQRT